MKKLWVLVAMIAVAIAPGVEAKQKKQPASSSDIIYDRACAAYVSGRYTLEEVYDLTRAWVSENHRGVPVPIRNGVANSFSDRMESFNEETIATLTKFTIKKVIKNCTN
jgi:Leu/Phe-tRNA-protein transferase